MVVTIITQNLQKSGEPPTSRSRECYKQKKKERRFFDHVSRNSSDSQTDSPITVIDRVKTMVAKRIAVHSTLDPPRPSETYAEVPPSVGKIFFLIDR